MADIETLEAQLQQNRIYETATFGMGCFWGHEAYFGSLPGVMRTRVGFAGGTSPLPSYRCMGDHTETIEIDFDTNLITYEDILKNFWRNHYPNRDAYKGRQYMSLLLYHSKRQLSIIEQVREEMEAELGEAIETEIKGYDQFTLAEERHQKYYLQRYPRTLEQLADWFPDIASLIDSTFAARLNGFVKGFSNRDALLEEFAGWPMSETSRQVFITRLKTLKW